MATPTVAIGVFNSCVMLLMNSFFMTANLRCRKRLRYSKTNERIVTPIRNNEKSMGVVIFFMR